MIAVAGYLNFSSGDLPVDQKQVNPVINDDVKESTEETDAAEKATDGAEGNRDDAKVSAPVKDDVADGQTPIGGSVLVDASSTDFVTSAKLNREQTRAKNKELLMQIIDNKNLGDKEKNNAIDQMLILSNNMEMETQTEQLLGAKGFTNSVVSIGKDSVDVLINRLKITDVEKAQIEDIVSRKTELPLDKLYISTIKGKN